MKKVKTKNIVRMHKN